jgi:virulence factor Mce-like protein
LLWAGLLAHVKWFTAFVAVVGMGLISYHTLLPGFNDEYKLKVPFDDANGLFTGSDVLIAGARAGTVSDITLQGNSALVTINLDPDHAPAHTDATVELRPKSLLGERYVDLFPGKASGTLPSNSTLPKSKVQTAVDLQDVVNSLDKPTREKLKTLVLELGGGVAGRGVGLNETIRYGTKDLNDLASVADTLRQRDAELETVIQALDDVLSELARSERRQQLGALIDNSNRLLTELNTQDEALKRALVSADAALTRTDTSLSGTQQALNDIFVQSPTLVNRVDLLLGDLGNGFDSYMPYMNMHLKGIKEGPIVFGGKTSQGYATRINVTLGPGAVVRQVGGSNSTVQDPLSSINGILFGPPPSPGTQPPALPAQPQLPVQVP